MAQRARRQQTTKKARDKATRQVPAGAEPVTRIPQVQPTVTYGPLPVVRIPMARKGTGVEILQLREREVSIPKFAQSPKSRAQKRG